MNSFGVNSENGQTEEKQAGVVGAGGRAVNPPAKMAGPPKKRKTRRVREGRQPPQLKTVISKKGSAGRSAPAKNKYFRTICKNAVGKSIRKDLSVFCWCCFGALLALIFGCS